MYEQQDSELPTDLGHLMYDQAMEKLVPKLQLLCHKTKLSKENIPSHRR